MNPLDLLKERLQTTLNESTESEDFKEALFDAIYACNLSTTALEQFIGSWVAPDAPTIYSQLDYRDVRYACGVIFVESEWYKITGMF